MYVDRDLKDWLSEDGEGLTLGLKLEYCYVESKTPCRHRKGWAPMSEEGILFVDLSVTR